MTRINCHCGSEKTFQECCEPYIKGIQKAPTAEALMRSRYSAYVTHAADYLVATTHISQRKYHSKKDILDWATNNKWLKLEIIQATENTVEFKAYFMDNSLQTQIHHEHSTFKLENASWFYVDGKFY
jgi:SEC-C motif-containing protein